MKSGASCTVTLNGRQKKWLTKLAKLAVYSNPKVRVGGHREDYSSDKTYLLLRISLALFSNRQGCEDAHAYKENTEAAQTRMRETSTSTFASVAFCSRDKIQHVCFDGAFTTGVAVTKSFTEMST